MTAAEGRERTSTLFSLTFCFGQGAKLSETSPPTTKLVWAVKIIKSPGSEMGDENIAVLPVAERVVVNGNGVTVVAAPSVTFKRGRFSKSTEDNGKNRNDQQAEDNATVKDDNEIVSLQSCEPGRYYGTKPIYRIKKRTGSGKGNKINGDSNDADDVEPSSGRNGDLPQRS